MQTEFHHCSSKQTLYCHDFTLEHGSNVDAVQLPYSIVGELSKPVVVVLGGISANHVVVDDHDGQGWWNDFVGTKKAIDTEQYCVISLSYLWGTEQHNDGLLISTYDQARLLSKLLDELSISQIHAIIGCSYGGMVALAFCDLFAQRVNRMICLCAAHRNSMKTIALRKIQRQIVQLAKKSGDVKQGMALARSLAMVGYRGETELEQRFNHTPTIVNGQAHFDINRYLIHNGRKFAEQFADVQFNNLSRSIDLHHVDPTGIATKSLLVAVNQDQMVPNYLVIELHCKLVNSRLHLINSDYGHDAFLLEKQPIADAIKPFINHT